MKQYKPCCENREVLSDVNINVIVLSMSINEADKTSLIADTDEGISHPRHSHNPNQRITRKDELLYSGHLWVVIADK